MPRPNRYNGLNVDGTEVMPLQSGESHRRRSAMRIQPEIIEVAIVLVGNLNPRIFTPDWFARNGLLTAREADEADIDVVHAQLTNFNMEWLVVRVEQERFQARTSVAPYVRISDLVVRTFREFLSHTPLTQMGINLDVHFDVGSFEARDRIGEMLAPKGPWGEWEPRLAAGEARKHGGMTSLSMQQRTVDDRAEGFIQAKVGPSKRIGQGHTGIYMQVNDHYEVEKPDEVASSEEIVDILKDRFEPSLERSKWIIDQIMALK